MRLQYLSEAMKLFILLTFFSLILNYPCPWLSGLIHWFIIMSVIPDLLNVISEPQPTAPEKELFFQLKSGFFFSYFSMKTYVKDLLMSTQNMFSLRNKKNISGYLLANLPLLTGWVQ